MTVANKPGHRGEHEVAVKTIARGMPGDPGVTVVTNARVYYTTRAAAGASDARHSLRPLMFRGYWFMHDSGAFAPRGRGGIPRRHCEEHLRRSNPAFYFAAPKLDCFAEPVIGRACARPVGSQ